MVGLGETAAEVQQLLARLARRRGRCRDHRPVSAAHAPQSAGRRLRRTAAVRGLSRVRPVDRISDGVQRPVCSQLLHGRQGQRRSSPGAKLNVRSGSPVGRPPDSGLPAVRFGLAGAVALAPLLVAVRREPQSGATISVRLAGGRRLLVGHLLLDPVRAGRFTADWATSAGWAVFLLFCLAKALHLGVFALAGRMLMRRWWAIPGVAALWVAIERTHDLLGFAWLALGNAGIDHGRCRCAWRPTRAFTAFRSSS